MTGRCIIEAMTPTSAGQDPGTPGPARGPAPAGLIWTRPPREKRERPTREAIAAAATGLAGTWNWLGGDLPAQSPPHIGFLGSIRTRPKRSCVEPGSESKNPKPVTDRDRRRAPNLTPLRDEQA